MQIIIDLSPAEAKAIAHIMEDVNEWAQYTIHNRCRIAIDEIVSLEVQRKLDAGEPITGSKDDIVMSANIETAVERVAREQVELAARIAAEQAAQQGA